MDHDFDFSSGCDQSSASQVPCGRQSPQVCSLWEAGRLQGRQVCVWFLKKIPIFAICSFPRSKSLSRLRLRRLQEEEKPLVLAVLWGRTGGGEGRKFVLQVLAFPEPFTRRAKTSIFSRKMIPVKFNGSSSVFPSLKTFYSSWTGKKPGISGGVSKNANCQEHEYKIYLQHVFFYFRIHEKYETVQEEILRLLHEKNREAE